MGSSELLEDDHLSHRVLTAVLSYAALSPLPQPTLLRRKPTESPELWSLGGNARAGFVDLFCSSAPLHIAHRSSHMQGIPGCIE